MESSSGRKEIFLNDFLVTRGQCRSQLNPVLFSSFYAFSIKLPLFNISKSLSILSQLSIRMFSQVKDWGTCLDWVSCVFKTLIYDGDSDPEPPENFCFFFQWGRNWVLLLVNLGHYTQASPPPASRARQLRMAPCAVATKSRPLDVKTGAPDTCENSTPRHTGSLGHGRERAWR